MVITENEIEGIFRAVTNIRAGVKSYFQSDYTTGINALTHKPIKGLYNYLYLFDKTITFYDMSESTMKIIMGLAMIVDEINKSISIKYHDDVYKIDIYTTPNKDRSYAFLVNDDLHTTLEMKDLMPGYLNIDVTYDNFDKVKVDIIPFNEDACRKTLLNRFNSYFNK